MPREKRHTKDNHKNQSHGMGLIFHANTLMTYRKLAAYVGEALPATPPTERGRGKKIVGCSDYFSREVIADYRKLARHQANGLSEPWPHVCC